MYILSREGMKRVSGPVSDRSRHYDFFRKDAFSLLGPDCRHRGLAGSRHRDSFIHGQERRFITNFERVFNELDGGSGRLSPLKLIFRSVLGSRFMYGEKVENVEVGLL